MYREINRRYLHTFIGWRPVKPYADWFAFTLTIGRFSVGFGIWKP